MAAIEWTGQGYEAFIFGEYGNPRGALIDTPLEDGEPCLPEDVISEIYDPIAYQIEKLIAMSYMYYKPRWIPGRCWAHSQRAAVRHADKRQEGSQQGEDAQLLPRAQA